MPDDVKARAREALVTANVLTTGMIVAPQLVRDLLTALEKAEAYGVERSKLANDTRHAAMQFRAERDEARNTIREVEKLRDRYMESAAGANGDAMLRLTIVVDCERD